MLETDAELDDLQRLLDRSHAAATGHLRGIITAERRLTARQVTGLLTGMKVVTLATVTAAGEPRISALDGHFLHASWVVGTSGDAAKARHLERRPAVSIAHVDGEELAVFAHGGAERLTPAHPLWGETLDHLTAHYGASPLSWGPDIRLYRCRPAWLVGYAADREALLAARGLS